MKLPNFIKNFDLVEVPFSPDMAKIYATKSERGLTAFMEVFRDIPAKSHSHSNQWGTILAGKLDMTIDGVTTTYKQGDSYYIPEGVEHAAKMYGGSTYLDIFEDPNHAP